MFGKHHCCYSSSSSCLSENRELAPTSAGAERQTIVFERAVHALHSASDVVCPTTTWRILPTIASALPHIQEDAIGSFQASAVDCRQGDDNGN